MLRSPALAGFVVYAGRIALDDNGKPVKASWPAIVDVKTWRAVQAILSDPARKTTPGTTPKHLCSGIIHCGKCGAKMRSGRVGQPEAGKSKPTAARATSAVSPSSATWSTDK
jgi:hypothetical protein